MAVWDSNGEVNWVSGLVLIGGMWLRRDAVWAVRPVADSDCCVVTGPGGAEFRLDVAASTAVDLLAGSG